MSNPADFLLPSGWVEMYMLQMPHLFAPKEHGPPLGPKIVHRQALLSLTRSFCNLILRVSGDTLFQHKLSGRTRLTYFVRRNVDFLMTCMLNAFSWRTSQSTQRAVSQELHPQYSQTRIFVQKVCKQPFMSETGISRH